MDTYDWKFMAHNDYAAATSKKNKCLQLWHSTHVAKPKQLSKNIVRIKHKNIWKTLIGSFYPSDIFHLIPCAGCVILNILINKRELK